jgi:hypothetical protein
VVAFITVVTVKGAAIPGTVVMSGTGAMAGVVDIDQQLRLATPNNRLERSRVAYSLG